MRLIDADALIGSLHNYGFYDGNDRTMVYKVIQLQPTIEPERKKGKWIPNIEKSREYIGTVLINVEYDYWFCDTCGYRVEKGRPMYDFCPNCGADMREGE